MIERDIELKRSEVAALRQEIEAKKNRIAELDAAISSINSVHVSPVPTMANLETIGRADDGRIRDLATIILELKQTEEKLSAHLFNIRHVKTYRTSFAKALIGVAKEAELARFDRAFEMLEEGRESLREFEETPFDFVKQAKEIFLYEEAAIYGKKASLNLANSLPPLTQEEAEAYRSLSYTLPADYVQEGIAEYHQDKAIGYLCHLLFLTASESMVSLENFSELYRRHQEFVPLVGNASTYTQDCFNSFHNQLKQQYNALISLYFEEERNYDKSLELFRMKDAFADEEIGLYAYVESKTEKEFYYCFLKASALQKDAESFNDTVLVLANKSDSDPDAFAALAHFVAMPLIDSTKFNILTKVIVSFPFQRQIAFFAEAVRLGLDEEKQVLLFDAILASKQPRKASLGEIAEDLHYLDFHVSAKVREKYDHVRNNLLRSPKAHRGKVKSDKEVVHLLFNEELEGNKPLGKPMKDDNINSWSISSIGVYWAMLTVLPIAAAALATALMFLNRIGIDNTYFSYFYIIPFLFYPMFFIVNALSWYGRDEKGTGIFCRIIGIDAFLKIGVAAAYFIAPNSLGEGGYLKVWALPLFISGVAEYLIGLFSLKEHNRFYRYFILFLVLAATAVATAFMVIGYTNGSLS